MLTKKLIQETKELIRLQIFLQNSVGIKETLPLDELRILVEEIKTKKNT